MCPQTLHLKLHLSSNLDLPLSRPLPPPDLPPAVLGDQHRVKVYTAVPPVKQPLHSSPLVEVDGVSNGLNQLERVSAPKRADSLSRLLFLQVRRSVQIAALTQASVVTETEFV